MKKTSPWAWIPTLYFAQGLPYVAVTIISLVMYKRLGISNTELAFYTGWLNLPWVIKPLWSPFIDLIKTKRRWIVTMQMLIGAGLAGIAFTIPTEYFFQLTLALFWLLAFSSATHDIAADGARFSRASTVCRYPQHLLPYCHHCRTRAAHHAGRPAGNGDRQHSIRVVHHLLCACRHLSCRVALPSFHPPPSGCRPSGKRSIRFRVDERILYHLYHLLPKKTRHRCHCIHAAIPTSRSPISQNGNPLLARPDRKRRLGTYYRRSRIRARNSRYHRTYVRRHFGRHFRSPGRS